MLPGSSPSNVEIILTFDNTHAAILAEQYILAAGIAVKVMPLPAAIAAGCGLCLRLDATSLEQGLALLHEHRIKTKAYRREGDTFQEERPYLDCCD